MNAFAILCVSLGFLSLVSVYLPNQVSQASSKQAEGAGVVGMIEPIHVNTAKKILGKTAHLLPAWLKTPRELEADVAFWRNIYATYSSQQTVFHDKQHLNIVYHVEDFSKLANDQNLSAVDKEKAREELEEKIKETIAAHLEQTGDLAAKDRVRAQWGLREKFVEGLKYSDRYLNEIEQIFESYGLPKELTRLIFVESLFNPQAHSSAGARGIWQFMRSSGKHYRLKINQNVDERTDPIKSSVAAAQLLKDNYHYLGSWPLAINAYNAGRGRMHQATEQLGTKEIARIVREFQHPSYGFASRNFYLEFLAAFDVVENREIYFRE